MQKYMENRWKVKKKKKKKKNLVGFFEKKKKKNLLLFLIQQCPRTFKLYSHFSYYVQNGDILQ